MAVLLLFRSFLLFLRRPAFNFLNIYWQKTKLMSVVPGLNEGLIAI